MILIISVFSTANGNQASFLRFKQRTKTHVVDRGGAYVNRGKTVDSFCYRKHLNASHASLGIAFDGSTKCAILHLILPAGYTDVYAAHIPALYEFKLDTDLTKCACGAADRRFRPLATPTVATLTLGNVITTVENYDAGHGNYRINSNNCVHLASHVWAQHVTGLNGGLNDHAIKCQVMANYNQSTFYRDYIDPNGTGVPHC
eukprot:CAMPEP_0115020516 /NCGR_PEP_ID=MMETSP0216-20121206/30214_1 /TAXON_ID=223996 /ORGANISM="Protocruzia adherens, Strain Boccale" /LENGTH=201 /DNA_ID=CAMNT_0002392449 /DNA_START=122 /DNA_END=727 /DNA_ORIENTATION=+